MDLLQPRFRARSYAVAQLAVTCPFCANATRVVAVALPVDHEVLDEQEAQGTGWQVMAANALIFHVAEISPTVAQRLRAMAPGFRMATDNGVQESLWSNHCEHCNGLLDDQDLHCEPGDGFVPLNAGQGLKIRLIQIDEPFEASAAGYSLEPEFLPFTRRA